MNYVPVTNGSSQPVILMQPSASYMSGPQYALAPQMSISSSTSPGSQNSTFILPQTLAPQYAALTPAIGGGALPGMGGILPSIATPNILSLDPTGGLNGDLAGLTGSYGG